MESSPAQAAGKVTAKPVGVIDVGANALRMVIAEVFSDGRIEALEQLHRAVRLGQDTFRRGRLGGQSMRAAVAVLRDYRQLLDLYKAEQVRAVATSAVREAANARHVPRPRLHGHPAERRGDRHLRGEPADGLRRASSGGQRLGRQPRAHARGRRGRREHPADRPGKRRDRHLAKPPAGIDPPARDVRHQRAVPAALRRSPAAAHLQHAVGDGEHRAAGGDRLVCGRRRRCPLRRPRNRRRHRLRGLGGDRGRRLRPARGALRAAHRRGTLEAARSALRRGRDPQSGPAWSTRSSCARRRPPR